MKPKANPHAHTRVHTGATPRTHTRAHNEANPHTHTRTHTGATPHSHTRTHAEISPPRHKDTKVGMATFVSLCLRGKKTRALRHSPPLKFAHWFGQKNECACCRDGACPVSTTICGPDSLFTRNWFSQIVLAAGITRRTWHMTLQIPKRIFTSITPSPPPPATHPPTPPNPPSLPSQNARHGSPSRPIGLARPPFPSQNQRSAPREAHRGYADRS